MKPEQIHDIISQQNKLINNYLRRKVTTDPTEQADLQALEMDRGNPTYGAETFPQDLSELDYQIKQEGLPGIKNPDTESLALSYRGPASEPEFDPSKPFETVELDPRQPFTTAEVNPEGSPMEAALSGFGKAASFGYLPQLQAVTEKLLPDPTNEAKESLAKRGFNLPGEKTYTQLRDEAAKFQEQLAQENPKASLAGEVAGTVFGGAAIPGGGAKTFLGKLGQAAKTGAVYGAIRNPGETQDEVSPIQLGERVKNVATDAALGTAAQGVFSGIGKIGEKIAKSPLATKTYAEMKALKASGFMKPAFQKAFGKGRAEELGRTVIDEKIVQIGDDISSIAKKAEKLKEESGQNIANIYKNANEQASDIIYHDPNRIIQDSVENELGSMRGQIEEASAGKRGASYVRDLGGYVNTSEKSTFPDWAANKGMLKKDITEALDRKSGKYYERLKDIAKENLRNGSYSPVSGANMPNFEFKALEMPGDKISNIKKIFQEEMSNPLLDESEIGAIKTQMDSLIKKHSGKETGVDFKRIAHETNASLDKYKKLDEGKAVIKEVSERVDNLAEQNGLADIQQAFEVRKSIDKNIKWNKPTHEGVEKELIAVRNKINHEIKRSLEIIDAEKGTDFAKQFTKENRRYTNLIELASASQKKAAGEEANAVFGLRERIAGGAGLVGWGIPGAIATTAATKTARTYGTPVVAIMADKIAKILSNNPTALRAFSAPLLAAKKISPQRLAVQVNMLKGNPEFVKLIQEQQ